MTWSHERDEYDNEYTHVHDGEGKRIGIVGRNCRTRTRRLWYQQETGEGVRGHTAENMTCHDDAENEGASAE